MTMRILQRTRRRGRSDLLFTRPFRPPSPYGTRILMRFWGAPLLGLLMYATPLLSQSSSDAFDWIRQNMGGAACVVFQMGPSRASLKQVTENTEVQLSDCNMTLETATTNGARSELRTFHVPLGKLNSNAVSLIEGFKVPSGWISSGEVPPYTLRLAAPAGMGFDAKYELFGVDAPRPTEYRASEVLILLREKDTAARLVTEMSRAIRSCHY
jgi:hypothetical protein